MSALRERDAMICRSCGQEERASEGYPCKDCGTFICIMCVFKGVVQCSRCVAESGGAQSSPGPAVASPPSALPDSTMDWPDH